MKKIMLLMIITLTRLAVIVSMVCTISAVLLNSSLYWKGKIFNKKEILFICKVIIILNEKPQHHNILTPNQRNILAKITEVEAYI